MDAFRALLTWLDHEIILRYWYVVDLPSVDLPYCINAKASDMISPLILMIVNFPFQVIIIYKYLPEHVYQLIGHPWVCSIFHQHRRPISLHELADTSVNFPS